MWVPALYRCYIVSASFVATGSLRCTAFSGCRMTGWQPASLRVTQLSCYCRCWPLARNIQAKWILGRLAKCVHLSVRDAHVGLEKLLVIGPLMLIGYRATNSLVFVAFICNPRFPKSSLSVLPEIRWFLKFSNFFTLFSYKIFRNINNLA